MINGMINIYEMSDVIWAWLTDEQYIYKIKNKKIKI